MSGYVHTSEGIIACPTFAVALEVAHQLIMHSDSVEVIATTNTPVLPDLRPAMMGN